MSRFDHERVRQILAEELGDVAAGDLDGALDRAVQRLSRPSNKPRPPAGRPPPGPPRHGVAADNPQRLAGVVGLRRQGLTLQDIGARYGLTRERIRQLLKLADPTGYATAEGKRARLAAQASAQASAQAQLEADWAATAEPCRVCLGPRPYRRRRMVNCTSECSRLWVLCRIHLDPATWQHHREAVARWSLAHPDSKAINQYKLRSSRRVLDGTAGRHLLEPYSPAVLEGLARVEELRSLRAGGPGGASGDAVGTSGELGS